MTLEVLLSCMNQSDLSLVKKSRLTSDVLIINQCENNARYVLEYQQQSIRRIDTTERGLSRSRNMALGAARGDICLLCDDDEVFLDHYEMVIKRAFERIPNADIIIFRVRNHPCRLKSRVHKLKYLQCLKVSSCQIALRRESLNRYGVRFDVFMGAGTGNGGGEENKFLLDCYKMGAGIYYVPEDIASLQQKESTWFKGCNRDFFYQRGIATRYMLGYPLSIAYAFFYVLTKKQLYCRDISMGSALLSTLTGIKKNDIEKQRLKKSTK